MPDAVSSKTALPDPRSTAPIAERRREARSRAQGAVNLLVEDPAPQLIGGVLLDVSPSGFRALHQCRWLKSGREIRFQHRSAAGRARVMWSRILPDSVESGFLILRA